MEIHSALVMLPGLLIRLWNFLSKLPKLMPSCACGASASTISHGWILSVGGGEPLGVAVPGLLAWMAMARGGLEDCGVRLG